MPHLGQERHTGVELYVVNHAVVERVPEISGAVGFDRRHAEVVDISSEVGLSGDTDGYIVGDIMCRVGSPSIVTVRLVISRADHIWLGDRDGGHFIIVVV